MNDYNFPRKTDIPQVLYKYRVWDNEYHRKLITNQELFFAPPSSFDDPMDCKNPIRFDLLSKAQRFELAEFISKQRNFTFNRKRHREWAKERSHDKSVWNMNFIHQIEDEYWKKFNQKYGVLSLTADPYNDYMWEIYGGNHQGFCLGYYGHELFDLNINLGFVQYENSLPNIFPEPFMSSYHQHVYQVFFKEEKWSSEEEYRCTMMSEDGLSDVNRALKIPANAFAEVILGKRMSAVNKKSLIDSIPSELKIDIVEL